MHPPPVWGVPRGTSNQARTSVAPAADADYAAGFFTAELRLLMNCSFSACAITTGADHGFRRSGNVICKLFNLLLTASHFSKVGNSKSTPYSQNKRWLKVPSDSTSSSMPKAFVEFTSCRSFHFDCFNLTYFTVWCHIWRQANQRESAELWKTSGGKGGSLSHING